VTAHDLAERVAIAALGPRDESAIELVVASSGGSANGETAALTGEG
jgi:hypothetical protein